MSFAIAPVSSLLATSTSLMASSAAERVFSVLAEELDNVDQASLTLDTTFESILPEGDSTKIEEIVQAIELDFEEELDGENIPVEVYRDWVTIGDGVRYIEGLNQ